MKRRYYYILGVVLLIGFAGFALASFRQTLTPYVSFDAARHEGRTVQVAGALVNNSTSYDLDSKSLRFTLKDPKTGEELPIRYHGLRPANFDDAISIVAIGTYDAKRQELAAAKLLVKCPSKYQGQEVKTYS